MFALNKEKGGLYATFYQIDVFGGFLLLFFPVSLAIYLSEKEITKIIFYSILTWTYGVCLLLTYSRGALLSVLASLFVFYLLVFLRKVKYQNLKALIFRSFVIFGLILLGSKLISKEKITDAVPERLKTRAVELLSEGDSSKLARWQFWVAAVKISLKHPWIGTGLKTFGRFYPPYEDDIRHFSKYPHNLYLQFLSEMGLFSFISFLAVVFVLFKKHFGLLKEINMEKDGFQYYSHFGIAMGAFGSFVHHFVDVDWFFLAIPSIWLAFFASSMGRVLRYTTSGEERAESVGERDEDFMIEGLSRHMAVQFFICLLLMIAAVLMVPPYFSRKFAETGDILRGKGKVQEAIQVYIQAIRFDPYDSEFQRNLGNLYLIQSATSKDNRVDVEFAEYYAKKAIELDKYRAVLHHFLGKIYWKKGLYNDALRCYERAMVLDSKNYPSFYNDIANYYLMKNDYVNARTYFLGAINLFPDDVLEQFWFFRADPTKLQLSGSYEGLGNICLKEKKYQDAEKYLKKSVELDGNNYSALFALGFAEYKQGKYDEAIINFDKSSKLEPEFSLCYLFVAYCYERLGKMGEAQEFYEKAYKLNPRLKIEAPPK